MNLQTFHLKRAPKMHRCSWKWSVLAKWCVYFLKCCLAQLSGIWWLVFWLCVILAREQWHCPSQCNPAALSCAAAQHPWSRVLTIHRPSLTSSLFCLVQNKMRCFYFPGVVFPLTSCCGGFGVFFSYFLVYIVGIFISSPVFILKRGIDPTSP